MAIDVVYSQTRAQLVSFLQSECTGEGKYFSSVGVQEDGETAGLYHILCYTGGDTLTVKWDVTDNSDGYVLLRTLTFYKADGTTRTMMTDPNSVSNSRRPLRFIVKTPKAAMFTFSRDLTNDPDALPSTASYTYTPMCVMLTYENSGKTVVICSKSPPTSTSGATRSAVMTQPSVNCETDTLSLNIDNTFTQVITYNMWTIAPFSFVAEGMATSFTPNAYRILNIPAGRTHTNYDIIEDTFGNRYIHNGYWIIRDENEPEPETDEENEQEETT